MIRSVRVMAALVAVGVAALGATEASARGGFGGGHGGFGGGFGRGFGHHGGWGRHYGWGPRFVGVVPAYYGTCYVKRFINEDGDLVVRKICE
ncbi:hypothetical protein [Methylobacterium nigriterrae]|uniref:hypothetical protein n=1 Tax=Methylobacterium nigriterrae TaxID=3127512 RepID=UPI003013E9DC